MHKIHWRIQGGGAKDPLVIFFVLTLAPNMLVAKSTAANPTPPAAAVTRTTSLQMFQVQNTFT